MYLNEDGSMFIVESTYMQVIHNNNKIISLKKGEGEKESELAPSFQRGRICWNGPRNVDQQ